MEIAAGKILCMQGDSPHSFYIVKKGTLVATFKDEQNEIQTKNLGPGSTFGELSLVDGEPLEYTVRARPRKQTQERFYNIFPFAFIHPRKV